MIKKAIFSRLFISLICVLVLIEVGVRVMSTTLSSNIEHIHKIPNISEKLLKTASDGHGTVLVMGNSLIGNAVNIKQLDKALNKTGTADVAAFKVVPDATALWDWYCIAKNNFTGDEQNQGSPDTVIIGFAWRQLEDREKVFPSRLAAYFCTVSDLPELHSLGMDHSSEVLEFLVASVSKLYALREVIHKRILDLFIYKYRRNARYTNNVAKANAYSMQGKNVPQENHRLLSKYIELLSTNNIKPVFVAMPVKKLYALNPDTVQLINNSGADFYDLRYMHGISNDMFIDPIHLGAEGSSVFTAYLADKVSEQLRRQGRDD